MKFEPEEVKVTTAPVIEMAPFVITPPSPEIDKSYSNKLKNYKFDLS
jgi:hypothetical protein